MPNTIRELDTVALLTDLPEFGLKAGEVGCAVHAHGDGAFEVEFVDNFGATYGLHTLRSVQLVGLHNRGETLRLRSAA